MNTASSSAKYRMPVLFVGHGSPMHALGRNRWSDGFAQLSELSPMPKAVLVVSAHWYLEGSLVTAQDRPKTIHDFGGFPDELYQIEYPAPGSPELAERVRGLLGADVVKLSTDWGLDHGTWCVLRWMYPDASIPVIQLSMDRRLSVRQHFELAQKLRPLRDEGVLIMGSGNVVHNLRDAMGRARGEVQETPDWASRFDLAASAALGNRDVDTLVSMASETNDGRVAHPTIEHWLPLIYAFGAADERDSVSFPVEGFDMGSMSMRSVLFDAEGQE